MNNIVNITRDACIGNILDLVVIINITPKYNNDCFDCWII